jgi:hypothetical protein
VELQQKGRNFGFDKAGTDVIVCWTNTDEICFFVLAAIFFSFCAGILHVQTYMHT